MTVKEATARIKINKLLEVAGWRFFADGKSPANIQLEPSITIKTQDLDALGQDFEKSSKGFIDFLLLNEKGFPFIVLEAKAEDKSPLVGKEQARKYARSQNCRFIMLSNGNLHYFWDLERGNPYVITSFPTPTSVMGYQKTVPDSKRLVEEKVDDDYVLGSIQDTGSYSVSPKQPQAKRNRLVSMSNGVKTMSSLEIAELTGKDHGNLCADIRNTLGSAEISVTPFESSYIHPQNKQSYLCYNLPRLECDLVITGYVYRYKGNLYMYS